MRFSALALSSSYEIHDGLLSCPQHFRWTRIRNLIAYDFAFPKSISMQRLRPQSTLGSKLCQQGIHGRSAPEIEELYKGNKADIAKMSEMNAGLLQSLAHNGQSAFFLCSIFKTYPLFFFRAFIYDSRLFR